MRRTWSTQRARLNSQQAKAKVHVYEWIILSVGIFLMHIIANNCQYRVVSKIVTDLATRVATFDDDVSSTAENIIHWMGFDESSFLSRNSGHRSQQH